ncbi:hypothetical protein Tco_1029939 [Tanacetum coccineum]|uniref:Uncharacterized protein n=1 Tax=Tanacetum coccineum TaxID=301880 RepID=A0ABQ5G617_9ASTR
MRRLICRDGEKEENHSSLCVLAMKAWLGLGRYGGTEKDLKARQHGFKDGNECPELSKLASDYVRNSKGFNDELYVYFSNEKDVESVCANLVKELERCILGYFAFHWCQASLMINQVAKKNAHKSKTLSTDIEGWEKGCCKQWDGKSHIVLGIAPMTIIDRRLPFEYTIASRSTDVMVPISPAPVGDSATDFETYSPYEMLQELKSMFEKQARVERVANVIDVVPTKKPMIAVNCKAEEKTFATEEISFMVLDEDMIQELAEEYMDHLEHDKSKGGALIHKNHEGSKHEGRKIRPTMAILRPIEASNQSPFNNGRIKEREEEKNEDRPEVKVEEKIVKAEVVEDHSEKIQDLQSYKQHDDNISTLSFGTTNKVGTLKTCEEIIGFNDDEDAKGFDCELKVDFECVHDLNVHDLDYGLILRMIIKNHINFSMEYGRRVEKYEGFRVDVKRKSIEDKIRREKVFDVDEPLDIENHEGRFFLSVFQEEDEFEYAEPLDGEAEQHYNELVTCDVVNMEACHVLLGRPWKHDMDATHQAERKDTGVSYALVVKGIEDAMENAISALIKPLLAEFGKIVTNDTPDALLPLRNIQH